MHTSYQVPSAAPREWVDAIREALPDGNIPTLLMVLRHLTGDPKWTAEPYRPLRGKPLDDNDSGELPAEIQREVREAVLDAVIAYREGRLAPVQPAPEAVAEMLACAMVEDVPAEYGELLSEEMGFISRDVALPDEARDPDFRVVIIGAGLSGLAMGIQLASAGVNFTILEKDDDLGGTWLENVYPGCGVDTPGHLYTFSFAPNPDITRYFARQAEVQGYLQHLADRFDLRRHIQFGTEVAAVRYESGDGRWTIDTRANGQAETIRADVVISAVGMVNRPSIPELPGLDEFPGPVLHTAAWDPAVDLSGKRVAVIGSAASAMQLVPSIADDAAHVTVFQRSKQWAVPHPNYHREVPSTVQFLMREVPFYLQWYRLRAFWNFSDRLHSSLQIDPNWEHPERSVNATNERHRVFLTKYIKDQLGDRTDLIDACLPDYPPYGKRPLIDNNWYRTMTRDDVTLVDAAVAKIDGSRVVAVSGDACDADVIALATGFNILQFLWPMDIVGRSGKTLREQWGVHDAKAYLGVTVPDFPNFFILNGPNTNAGHGGSAIHATEFQVRYVMEAIGALLQTPSGVIEVDRDRFEDYNAKLDEALSHCIWSHPGMTTYYRNEFGRIVVTGPWKYIDYWRLLLPFDRADYHEVKASVDAGELTG
ncbi:4-hydroxyacetophenone monooxygenase [Mycolicibacterium sp. BK556]|uniref:flavin-containing monooxygenase n=1 Tax=unclassified Mycolicibacterium TaxID=2636767 RepID=UPI00160BFEDD|nr:MULTISPECIES: NAD(P)/FAD-dependent oxidoreductase [unclassified Mycolicibacterium]MBB3600664.1 4-hydroxyacetophenone monooxygenase [Mycolicibacterium sp. BK556]MBB3630417.1 4-hydroxyacetophenone monooxygenase [Mycolicibacterium sp. BK607]